MITPALEITLRRRAGTVSYRKLGAELQCSAGHLLRIEQNQREASDELLERLGLERIVRVTYRRKRNGD